MLSTEFRAAYSIKGIFVDIAAVTMKRYAESCSMPSEEYLFSPMLLSFLREPLQYAAIMLAWVACGRLTSYWEPDLVRPGNTKIHLIRPVCGPCELPAVVGC